MATNQNLNSDEENVKKVSPKAEPKSAANKSASRTSAAKTAPSKTTAAKAGAGNNVSTTAAETVKKTPARTRSVKKTDSGSEPAKPVAVKTAVAKTSATKTATAKTSVAKPVVAKPAVAKTSAIKTSTAKTSVAKPAAEKKEIEKTSTEKATVAKPAVARKPGTVKVSGVTETVQPVKKAAGENSLEAKETTPAKKSVAVESSAGVKVPSDVGTEIKTDPLSSSELLIEKNEIVSPINIEDNGSDYQALEKMMQSSGLRKKSEDSYASYREKKSKKKFVLIPLLFLALLGAGILGGVKYFGSMGTSVEKPLSIEDKIADAEKLIARGKYSEALDILSVLEVPGDDDYSKKLRMKIGRDISSVLEKSAENGRDGEIFEKIDLLIENGDVEKALRILGAFETKGLSNPETAKNKIHSLEKKAVDKAAAGDDVQSVMEAAKKLMDNGSSVSAAEILSLLDIEGNDTKSRLIRNQIYSLKKDAVNRSIEDGKTEELFDSAEAMIEDGQGIRALELLSYADVKGNDVKSEETRNKLLELKKKATDKIISDGKKDELIGTARQMISDGDYETALEFMSSIKNDGDDSESRAFRNELKTLEKDVVERASAEGRLDNVLDTAEKLSDNGQYTDAIELLNMINTSGNSKESKALRKKINSIKSEIVANAIADGKKDEILYGARQLIEDGDYSGALELLGSVKVKGDDKESKEFEKQIDSLLRETVSKAVRDGMGDEVLDTAENFMKNDDFKSAENILNYLESLDNSPEAKKMQEKTSRLKNRLNTLEQSESMSDDEKISLAEKLMGEGRIEEALALLNSMDAGEDNSPAMKAKLDEMKKKAVEEGKKRGIDTGLFGYDENGNPILSKDEIAKKQEQDRLVKEAAEKKAEEEKFELELQKQLEEKLKKERELQKITIEKKEKEAEKKKAEYERKLKAENDRKVAEEKKRREEAEKKAEAEKHALEEALKKAEEEKRLLEEKQNEIISSDISDLSDNEESEKLKHDQNRMDIESAISRAKKFLEDGDVESAMKEFSLAESMMDSEDEDYAAERLSEIAKALYDASEKTSGSEKRKLKNASGSIAKSAAAKNCNNSDPYFIAGMNELDKKKLSDAEAYFRKAIEKNPDNYLYYYQLGRVLAMQKKNPEALKNFARCIELNDRFAPAFYNSGYVNEQLGNTKSALDFYVKAASVNPNHENAYIGQGHMLMELSQFAKAKEAFHKALNLNQKRAQIYQELGSCYAAEKDYNSAEGYFKKALLCPDSTNEKNAITYYNLSSVMYDQNKKAESMDYAKKAYENKDRTDPVTKANIIYVYGLLTQEKGDDALAVQLYKEALAVNPKHVKANTNLGVLLLKKDDAANAVIALTLAYEVEPDNFEVNNNLGSAYRNISKFDKSAIHYKKALSIKPNDLTVMQNLARSYASAKDYKKARSIYETLIKKEPKKWDHLLELSRVCIFDGDPVSAEGYLAFLKASAPDFHKAEVEAMLDELK